MRQREAASEDGCLGRGGVAEVDVTTMRPIDEVPFQEYTDQRQVATRNALDRRSSMVTCACTSSPTTTNPTSSSTRRADGCGARHRAGSTLLPR
jgi:hypothetical protein